MTRAVTSDPCPRLRGTPSFILKTCCLIFITFLCIHKNSCSWGRNPPPSSSCEAEMWNGEELLKAAEEFNKFPVCFWSGLLEKASLSAARACFPRSWGAFFLFSMPSSQFGFVGNHLKASAWPAPSPQQTNIKMMKTMKTMKTTIKLRAATLCSRWASARFATYPALRLWPLPGFIWFQLNVGDQTLILKAQRGTVMNRLHQGGLKLPHSLVAALTRGEQRGVCVCVWWPNNSRQRKKEGWSALAPSTLLAPQLTHRGRGGVRTVWVGVSVCVCGGGGYLPLQLLLWELGSSQVESLSCFGFMQMWFFSLLCKIKAQACQVSFFCLLFWRRPRRWDEAAGLRLRGACRDYWSHF